MVITGTVTNVANFGAFIDIGVHQDGLVHISQLADVFVKNPYDIVSVGDTVQVEVLEIDAELKRIALKRLSGGKGPVAGKSSGRPTRPRAGQQKDVDGGFKIGNYLDD